MPEENKKEDLQKEINEKKVEAYNAERQIAFYTMLAASLHQEIAELEAKLKTEEV